MKTSKADGSSLIINGQRELILAGEIHYARCPETQWADILRRSRECGLNTIQSYVFWGLHERERGKPDFTGRLDLARFCEEVSKAGMHLILRLGPYCCAEINYGGFPPWLRDVPGIQMRTWNQPYMQEMERWIRLLGETIRPYAAENGGPIIMAEIENEYNALVPVYGEEGMNYMRWALDLAHSLELNVPWLSCVNAPGSIETLHGFVAWEQLPHHREAHPDQPALWTEHWTGWLTAFGFPRNTRSPEAVARGTARFVAEGGAGVTYYMWHGGTNFGRDSMYLQVPTYSFDDPFSEFGFPTTKARHLSRLHHLLQEHQSILLSSPPTEPSTGIDGLRIFTYGGADGELTFLCNDSERAVETTHRGIVCELPPESVALFSGDQLLFHSAVVHPDDSIHCAWRPAELHPSDWRCIKEPLGADRPSRAEDRTDEGPIEQLKLTGDRSDYCWYSLEFTTPEWKDGMGLLHLPRAADFLYLYLDGELVAETETPLIEDRGPTDTDAFSQVFRLHLSPGEHRLDILCTAVGMIKHDTMLGFQNMAMEKKGLWAPILWRGERLPGTWTMRPFLLGELDRYMDLPAHHALFQPLDPSASGPAWYAATFSCPNRPGNVALDMASMNKGLIWLNGHCVSRYWLLEASGKPFPWVGQYVETMGFGEPSQRYYRVPSEWIKPENVLVVFEEKGGNPEGIRWVEWCETDISPDSID